MLKDVIDGYISAQAARELYGIVITGGGRGIDSDATAALRKRMRADNGMEGRGVSVAAE